MTRRDLLISVIVGVVLTILATATGMSQRFWRSVSDAKANTTETEVAEILDLMLQSHTTWKTLDAEISTSWHFEGQNQTSIARIQIEQPVKVSFDLYNGNDLQLIGWDSNETELMYSNFEQQKYAITNLPGFIQDLSFLPKEVPISMPETVYRHPLAMLIPSVASDYIYPIGLIQRGGEYHLSGKDQVAGRTTWILDWERRMPSGQLDLKTQFWVDMQTGMILKAISYSGEQMDQVFEETTFTFITFDQSFSPDNFSLSSIPSFQQVPLSELFENNDK